MDSAQRINAAAPPAHTLLNQRGDGNRRKSLREGLLHCIAAKIQGLDAKSGLKVLGNGSGRNAADTLEGLTGNYRVRTCIEHRIGAVLAEVYLAEEIVLLIRDTLLRIEVVLKQIGIVKDLRRLDKSDFTAVLLLFLRLHDPSTVGLLLHNGKKEIRHHFH